MHSTVLQKVKAEKGERSERLCKNVRVALMPEESIGKFTSCACHSSCGRYDCSWDLLLLLVSSPGSKEHLDCLLSQKSSECRASRR